MEYLELEEKIKRLEELSLVHEAESFKLAVEAIRGLAEECKRLSSRIYIAQDRMTINGLDEY